MAIEIVGDVRPATFTEIMEYIAKMPEEDRDRYMQYMLSKGGTNE